MSIYCYLACKKCREVIFVKDADTDVHADPRELGQFLEKHAGHDLVFLWEWDHTTDGTGADACPPEDWERYKPTPGGVWSKGNFISDSG